MLQPKHILELCRNTADLMNVKGNRSIPALDIFDRTKYNHSSR